MGLGTGAAVAIVGCGVDIVVAPESVCPKCITGALKLKFGGIKGALGAERPGASPGAPTQKKNNKQKPSEETW
jgi:hypothetical protein